MIDTCVNSDWAKTITVTFVLKIINSKLVSSTSSDEADLSGLMWKRIKIYP